MLLSETKTWGSTAEERRLSYRCERQMPNYDEELYRAVTVDAPAPVLFRWLCQLRAAPYSYDWIDNRGRRSPRRLTPGLERLEVGQPVMTIFDLVEFEQDRHLTLLLRRRQRAFGEVAVTYLIAAAADDRCRLLVKLRVRYPSGVRGALYRRALPLGDTIMMRKQLLTLKDLAEGDAQPSAHRTRRPANLQKPLS